MPTEEKNEATFEESLEQLEAIIHQLEDGRSGLSQSLESYERGVKCLKRCYQVLQATERKIEILSGLGTDGQAETQPFDDAEMTLDEKQQKRSRRRSRSPRDSGNSVPASGEDVDAPGRLF